MRNKPKQLDVALRAAIEEEKGRLAELDIWLGAEAYCGKGFGTAAFEALCARLHANHGVVSGDRATGLQHAVMLAVDYRWHS